MLVSGCGSDSGSPNPTPDVKITEYAYVTNVNDALLSEFSVDLKTGALTLIGMVDCGCQRGAMGLTVTPDQQFLYVANNVGSDIHEYAIDPANGMLTQVGDVVVGGGNAGPVRVAAEGASRILYVLDRRNQEIWAYTIADNGVLALVVPAEGESNPISTGATPTAIVANDNNVYLTNRGNGTISVYTINGDGTLISDASVDSLGTVLGLPTDEMLVGEDFYSSDSAIGTNGGIAHFNIGNNGQLTFVAVTPSGATSNAIPQFITAAPDTNMAFTSDVATVVPAGDVASQANTTASISAYSADPGTGALTFETLTGFTGEPWALSADQSGQFLYVPNLQNGTVAQYLIDTNTHSLTPIAGGSVDTENPPNPNSGPFMVTTAVFCSDRPCG